MKSWQEKSQEGLLDIRTTETHRVRVYEDRLAISRKDGQRLTWEELQQVKQEIWGDRVCVEVYPAQPDVVNLRHTRHLWNTRDIETFVGLDCRHAEFE